MCEAVQELKIAGVSMDQAVWVVGVTVMTTVTVILKQTVWAAASGMGGMIACGLAGVIVLVVYEAISGAVERKELERRVGELEEAQKTIHDNRVAIVNCAEQLRDALIAIQVMSGKVGDGKGFSLGYVSPLIPLSLLLRVLKGYPDYFPFCRELCYHQYSDVFAVYLFDRWIGRFPLNCSLNGTFG